MVICAGFSARNLKTSLILGFTKMSPNKVGQKQVFRKTYNPAKNLKITLFFNCFKEPWPSYSKNYIQMKKNLKNMALKNCSFPTYLVPPF